MPSSYPVDPPLAVSLLGFPEPQDSREGCENLRTVLVKTPIRQYLSKVSCKLWRCHACFLSLRWNWGLQAIRTVYESSVPLYHAEVNEAAWHTARRGILKAKKGKSKGVYFRVSHTTISTSPVAFDKNGPVRNDEAIRRIGNALSEILQPRHQLGRFRPVTTSRVWAIGKPPKGEGKLVAVLSGKVKMRDALGEMRNLGIDADMNGFGTSISFPAETDTTSLLEVLRLRRPFVRAPLPNLYETVTPRPDSDDPF
jgi:hypothetical protein